MTSVSSNHSRFTLLMSRESRRHLDVGAEVEQEQARVDEVGLSLDFAGSQVRHQAEAVDQIHAEQLDRLPLPVAELAAGEVRIVEDGVEAVAFDRPMMSSSPDAQNTLLRNRTQSRSYDTSAAAI